MKKIILSFFLTLLVNILCLPLWTEYGYGGFVRTLFTKEARLDLLYSGKITCAEPCQYEITPKPLYSTWVYESGNNVHQANLSLKARGKWQRLSFRLKAQRDGKITILFRGPNVRDEYGSPYSVLTDYRNIKINGKSILSEQGVFSFIKSFTKQFSVKKGDFLHIEAEFRRHHFSIHDFTGLQSGMIWYIITGNLLFFPLIYRLLSYIQGGGIRKGDAFLLEIFFSLLFIPLIGISDAVKSVREHRMLANKPKLEDIFKEKSDYGRRYENWFNDHLCGRVPLIKLHDILRNELSYIIRTKKAIYLKETGWEFHLPLVQVLDCRPAFVQSIVQNLVQLNQFCQQNRIKLYVLEVPRKEIVYKELTKENYGFDEGKFIKDSQTRETIRNKVWKHQIPYIYPYRALRVAMKSDFVFFKWKHHWTEWGAYVGYRELMKEIIKDFPDMPVISLDDYWKSKNWLIRDEYWRSYDLAFNLREYFNNTSMDDPPNRVLYSYYDHKNSDKMVFKLGKFTKDFVYPAGKHKIMLIGTSQNENLLSFLPYSAAQTKYIRTNMGQAKASDEFKILKLYKKDILAFKPNILILSIGPGNLPALRNLCSIK